MNCIKTWDRLNLISLKESAVLSLLYYFTLQTMWEYLYYTTDIHSSEINDFLYQNVPENFSKNFERIVAFTTHDDVQWAKENNKHLVQIMQDNLWRWYVKMSWWWWESAFNETSEEFAERVTKIFETIHAHFKIKIYSASSALSLDYFTHEQLNRITRNKYALLRVAKS